MPLPKWGLFRYCPAPDHQGFFDKVIVAAMSLPKTELPKTGLIAFQGEPGAYSDLAAREARPDMETLACRSFESAFQALRDGRVDLAIIPIENSLAGRVADVHHLLPDSGMYIIGEHFLRVKHCLLAVPGARPETIKDVYSHVHALGQCRGFLQKHNLHAVVAADTAGSAKDVARSKSLEKAAIASKLAARIYGLEVLKEDVEDARHNTTRFIIMSRKAAQPSLETPDVITSFVFEVKNLPASLYKAMGGFATNGINMTKLESYMVGGHFIATQFFAEVEAHPQSEQMRRAMDELRHFSKYIHQLGCFEAHPFRRDQRSGG